MFELSRVFTLGNMMTTHSRSKILIALFLCLFSISPSRANIVGADTQTFNPITSGLDFVTVQSSETLRPGFFNIGIFLNQAWGTLPRFQGAFSNFDYSDSILSSDVNVGFGIMKNWDFGFSVPAVLRQSLNDNRGFEGSYSRTGYTEFKLNTKYRLLGDDSGGLAAILSTNINRIENNPYSGVNGKSTYNLEFAWDTTLQPFTIGFNAGHRWRRPGTPIPRVAIEPLRNQWIASTAANYMIPNWDSKLILEFYGSLPVAPLKSSRDRQETSLEGLIGIKHDFTNNVAGHFGFTREVLSGLAAPDFRLYAGVNINLGSVYGPESEPGLERVRDTPKEVQFIAENLGFESGSDQLKPSAKLTLDTMGSYLKSENFKKLTVEGHTDSIGNDGYNQNLSERRAQAVRAYLVQAYKFEGSKITAIGYGETMPIADNGNYQGRQKNRRVEFKIER